MKNKRAKSTSEDITVPVGTKKSVSSIEGGSDKVKANKAGIGKSNKTRSGAIAQNMLPEDYRPSEDEEFMNPMQLLYFQRKLEAWKAE